VGPSGSALVADDHVVVDHVVAMETSLHLLQTDKSLLFINHVYIV
jgi:hypothetical protein